MLIYIPYHDEDNYYQDGILTRESAVLFMLNKLGFSDVISIKKPRTFLDKKRYELNESFYPDGSVEQEVRVIFRNADTIQYKPLLSIRQILTRRVWWIDGYKKTESLIGNKYPFNRNTLVYSDNPFAFELLRHLSGNGCRVFFDSMDNFAIHPSLNEYERSAALNGYCEAAKIADYFSANSLQTCDYLEANTGRRPVLIKNGVFAGDALSGVEELPLVRRINEEKKKYKRCAGYVGKIGLRIDADLIDEITNACSDTLFVFVGGFLQGQKSRKLMRIMNERANVLVMGSVPSAYVHSVMDQFDLLMIPHAVGKAENGGDPEKLYHYLTRKKPIITTGILGVDEFEKYIRISNTASEWIEYIRGVNACTPVERDVKEISWESRFAPVMNAIMKES